MPGPRPKPTALKILAGNPGKKPLNKSEPQPTIGTLRAPDHLSATAKRYWKEHAAELQRCGVLTVVDETGFAMLCESYATWLEAESEVSKKGRIQCVGKNGYEQISAWESIRRYEQAEYRKWCQEYGLTPASRCRISIPKAAEKKGFSQFD